MTEADDLRAVRAHFGLSQAELAEWLNIHRTQLAHAESGRNPLPLLAAARLTPLNICVARTVGAPPALPPAPTYVAALPARLTDLRYQVV